MEARVPMTMSMSLALHAGGIAGWLYLQQAAKTAPMRVISNVDIMVQHAIRQQSLPNQAPQPRRAMPKLSTMDLLKLALPTVPKSAPLEVKESEAKPKALVDIPEKLKDQGRLQANKPLDRLVDAGHTRAMAQLDASEVQTSRSHKALAELPKLEDVGMRRAPQAKIDMALAQEQQGRLQALDESVPSVKAPSRAPAALAAPLEEAQRPKSALSKMADMLTSDALPLPQARPMERVLAPKQEAIEAPDLPKQRETELATAKKKSVEIEGPLSNRKVTYYEIPQFPQWAADQGIPEADVKIRFEVDEAGNVMASGMRIAQTSGYGALDRLAMDTLKRWRFEAIASGTGIQWGIITFRFVLQ